MLSKTNILVKTVLTATLFGFFFISCEEEKENPIIKNDNKKASLDILTKSQSLNATLNGKVFSIPSPIETAILLKEKGGDFDEGILNDPSDVDKFSNSSNKALAMGVYGADLGYATIYDQNQKSIKFIKSIEKLSTDLGISGAFDKSLIDRFLENGNNQDSLLKFVSEAYGKGDDFLKKNKREDVSIKILTGGWIESIYFASEIYKKSNNSEIKQRIAEQKPTIVNLVSIYKEIEPESELTAQLISLNDLFKKVKLENSQVKVIDDEPNKKSVFQFESTTNMDDDSFNAISTKLGEIRTAITQ